MTVKKKKLNFIKVNKPLLKGSNYFITPRFLSVFAEMLSKRNFRSAFELLLQLLSCKQCFRKQLS